MPASAAVVGDRVAFATVGVLYLEQYPEEADAARLRRRLFGTIQPWTHRARRHVVVQRCAKEFEARDVVSIGGWLLARSEARLFALTWLEAGR